MPSGLSNYTQRHLLIEQYHKDTGIASGMSLAEAVKIAADMGLTAVEMAATVGASMYKISRWVKDKTFPPEMALHFRMLHSTITASDPLIPYHLFPKAKQREAPHHD